MTGVFRAVALVLILGWLAVWVAGCGRADATPRRAPGPFRAVVTIAPLKGLVEPLLPPGSDIYVVIPPGRSEHGYEFTPRDVAALAKADLVVLVGLGLEPRIERWLGLNETSVREVVSFGEAVGAEDEGGGHHHHDHVHTEECDHGDVDPHVWLDPVLCAELVPALRKAVEASLRKTNEFGSTAQKRLDEAETSLVAEIGSLHEWARAQLEPHAGKAIVTHHSAWGRLAERYGLKVAAVIRPMETAEPTPDALASAVSAIREQNVRAIFVEPQFDPAAARRIADAAGAEVATLDPLGDGDWFKMMRQNVESLAKALGR